jgi:hypothetical protein
MLPQKLLTIESSFVLTGLGVLVRGQAAPTEPLRRFALHTALAVELRYADGTTTTATASVEEVTRAAPDAGGAVLPEVALLLQLPESLELLPGTEVWLTGIPPDWVL